MTDDQQLTTEERNDSKKVTWSAPEFRYFEKTAVWYFGSIIIALALVAVALWQKNILFAIFIVIAELMVFFWGRQEPRQYTYTLSEAGLDIGGAKFYQYSELAGYAFVHDPRPGELSELVFQPKRRLGTYLKVFLPAETVETAKKFLTDRLPEIEYRESLAEHLMERMRF